MSKNTAGYFYEANRINRLFGISSIALLGSVLWMIWQDHQREWKDYQQQARAMEIQRLRDEITFRRGKVDPQAREAAAAALKQSQATLTARQAELDEADRGIKLKTSAWYQADQSFRAAKAHVDAARYRFEEANQHHGKDHPATAAAARDLAERSAEADALKLEQEKTQAALAEAQAGRRALTTAVDAARQQETTLLAEVNRLEKRLEGLDYSLVNDWLRDQPGVDYMAPLIKLPQPLTPPDLTDDYNFAQVQKVDRCNACHVNIDRPGYEKLAQPFTSHPRLDLYLGGRSSHPMNTFGCTTCHGGQGSSTDFLHAYHTPSDEKEAKAWEAKYGWIHFQHEHAPLWPFPMLPQAYVESSCRKCHTGRVELDAADTLNRGRHVFETAGCWGCHKVEGFEPKPDPKAGRVPTAADASKMAKVGPDLVHIGCKLSPDFTAKWLADPKAFRAHTRMPSFFGVSPDMDDAMRAREAAEIRAITAYLFNRSLSSQGPEFPPGDPARGKAVIETVGCMACHTIKGEGAARTVDLTVKQADFNAFGPDLGSIGSKTNQGWLFNWLKNPKHYFPEGRMPDLRLTDAEAADAAAYLMTLRDEAFEQAPAPAADIALMRQMLVEKLRSKESQAVVDYLVGGGPMPAEIADLPEDQRPAPIPESDIPVAFGEHTLRRYGCNACHVIPGFEDAQGIGAELTHVGSKDLAQVDFGFVPRFKADAHFNEPALRTRHAWLKQKVSDPRIFDMQRSKLPLDRLVMPKFGLSEPDAEALTAFLLSLNKEKVPAHRQERLGETLASVERGRRLVKDANCTACHVVGLKSASGTVPADEKARAAWMDAHRGAWIADHVLLTAKGDPERAASSQDALEKGRREKASERLRTLTEARTFLHGKAQLTPALKELLAAQGVDPASCSRQADVLAELEKARQTRDPFRTPFPFTVRIAGTGEGLPGRWIADRATKTSGEESGKFAPPFLMDLGARVRPDWLFRFLLDPTWDYARRGGQPIRPAVPLRMPTFGFTEAEAADLVRYFCATAEAAYPFPTEPLPSTDPAVLDAGRTLLTDAMGCRSCHEVDGKSEGAPVGPSLDHLHARLRRAWLERYIQAPNESQPFVVMPGFYKRRADGSLSDDDVVPDLLGNDPRRQLDAILDYLLLTASERVPQGAAKPAKQ